MKYYIGIDLGGTNIAIGIVDENYKIIVKGSVPTNSGRDNDEVVRDMANLCKSLVEEASLTFDDIEYAGIAAPGTVDPQTCVVKYSNNIVMFHYPIGEKLKGMIPIKRVYLENDANAAALGEAVAGAGKGCKNLVLITLGTGLGGGIVLDGKLYSGFNYAGAEIGHMGIVVDGKSCTCGRKGCWEAYSSATGLVNMTMEKMKETKDTVMWDIVDGDVSKVSGRTAFSAMKQGDVAGKEVVDMYLKYLAYGITNLVNIFQPEIFCIGGGISNEGDALLNPILEMVDRDQYGTNAHDDKTVIRLAELKNDAGIIGAAVLGL